MDNTGRETWTWCQIPRGYWPVIGKNMPDSCLAFQPFYRYCTRFCLTMMAGMSVAYIQSYLKKKKKKKITKIFDKATSVKTFYKQSSETGMPMPWMFNRAKAVHEGKCFLVRTPTGAKPLRFAKTNDFHNFSPKFKMTTRSRELIITRCWTLSFS